MIPTPALLTNRSIGLACSTADFVAVQLFKSTLIVSMEEISVFKLSENIEQKR